MASKKLSSGPNFVVVDLENRKIVLSRDAFDRFFCLIERDHAEPDIALEILNSQGLLRRDIQLEFPMI